MVYPANKTVFPVRTTDEVIPASDFNTQADAINEIQDALGEGSAFATFAEGIKIPNAKNIELGTTNTIKIQYNANTELCTFHFNSIEAMTFDGSQLYVENELIPNGNINMNGRDIGSGNKISLVTAGEGIVLRTPDDNNSYKVTIDNSGNLVTTLQ